MVIICYVSIRLFCPAPCNFLQSSHRRPRLQRHYHYLVVASRNFDTMALPSFFPVAPKEQQSDLDRLGDMIDERVGMDPKDLPPLFRLQVPRPGMYSGEVFQKY